MMVIPFNFAHISGLTRYDFIHEAVVTPKRKFDFYLPKEEQTLMSAVPARWALLNWFREYNQHVYHQLMPIATVDGKPLYTIKTIGENQDLLQLDSFRTIKEVKAHLNTLY